MAVSEARRDDESYPRRNDNGETVWACCESSIGPTCQHHWLPCAPCDGTGVVYAAGPDYFGNYDSGDCPMCHGYGSVAPHGAPVSSAPTGREES